MSLRSSLLVIPCLLLLSCGPPAPSLSESWKPEQIKDYPENLKSWTRTDKKYDDFENRITGHATFLSPRFRAAMLTEFQRVYKPTKADLEVFRTELEGTARQYETFFLSIFTDQREWNDLELRSSIWKVYLETDEGQRLAPALILPVRSENQRARHFFPYLGHFHVGYWVRFPRYPETATAGLPKPVLHPGTKWFQVRMSGPPGELVFKWDLN